MLNESYSATMKYARSEYKQQLVRLMSSYFEIPLQRNQESSIEMTDLKLSDQGLSEENDSTAMDEVDRRVDTKVQLIGNYRISNNFINCKNEKARY